MDLSGVDQLSPLSDSKKVAIAVFLFPDLLK